MASQKRRRVIRFSEPVEAMGDKVTELTMREPLVRDLLHAQVAADAACVDQNRRASPAEHEARLFSLLVGVPLEDMLDWPSWAYQDLQEAYVFLSRPGPAGQGETEGAPEAAAEET